MVEGNHRILAQRLLKLQFSELVLPNWGKYPPVDLQLLRRQRVESEECQTFCQKIEEALQPAYISPFFRRQLSYGDYSFFYASRFRTGKALIEDTKERLGIDIPAKKYDVFDPRQGFLRERIYIATHRHDFEWKKQYGIGMVVDFDEWEQYALDKGILVASQPTRTAPVIPLTVVNS